MTAWRPRRFEEGLLPHRGDLGRRRGRLILYRQDSGDDFGDQAGLQAFPNEHGEDPSLVNLGTCYAAPPRDASHSHNHRDEPPAKATALSPFGGIPSLRMMPGVLTPSGAVILKF